MANDKKFIVKNGLQSQENVVIGSSTDDGINKLQVTGRLNVTNTDNTNPSVTFLNQSTTALSPIAIFGNGTGSLQVVNSGAGDYSIYNNGASEIKFNNASTVGLDFIGGGVTQLNISSTGSDFKNVPTINGVPVWYAGNDGAGSGLDADLLDGINSLQFLRSDEDDTFNGNLVITGDLTVSGTTTTINTEELNIADNIVRLNSDFTASNPTENAGIEVERGTLTNSVLQWNETSDWWELNSAGTDLGRIITTADEGAGNGFDADSVDGLEAAQFLRSDTNDVATGNLELQGTVSIGNDAGSALLTMKGAGNNRVLASDNGKIGFLNSGLNYGTYSEPNGDWVVEKDLIAERFIDSADNSYVVHPSSNSILNQVSIDDYIIHNGDADSYFGFSNNDQYVLRLGGTNRVDVTSTAATFTNNVVAPKFVDSDDGTYFADLSNTGQSIVFAGKAEGSFGSVSAPTYSFFSDNDTGMYRPASNQLGFSTDGVLNLLLRTTRADFTNSVYAPSYYDSDDEAYFANFAGTSLMNTIGIDSDLFHNGDATTKLAFAPGEIDLRATGASKIAIDATDIVMSVQASVPTIYLADYVIHQNDTNTYFGFAGNDSFQIFTGGTQRFNIDDDSADFSVDVYAPNVRAARYYDTGDANYYLDPASTSQLNRIDIDDYIRHRGDTDNYFGFAANDTFRVFTGATQRLNVDNNSADFAVNVYAPRYFDSNNSSYYGDFASSSVMNTIGIDSDLFHNGDTDTKLAFGTDTVSLTTGGTSRLNVNNTYVEAVNQMRAPVYYGTTQQTSYLDLDVAAGSDSLRTVGRINIGGGTDIERYNDTTGNGGVTVSGYAGLGGTTNPSIQVSGANGARALLSLNKIDIGPNPYSSKNNYYAEFLSDGAAAFSIRGDNSRNAYFVSDADQGVYFYDSGASTRLAMLSTGDVTIGNDSIAFATGDHTPVLASGAKTAGKLHVDGSLHINGANDALVIGSSTATFLRMDELGFGQGGGFYMDSSTEVKVRGNKILSSANDAKFNRYLDGNDVTFFGDFASASRMNNITLAGSITHDGDTDTSITFGTNQFIVNAGGTNQFNVYATYAQATTDMRAPVFTDSADTDYSWNPNTTSAHRFNTAGGYVEIGPKNTTYSHFDTDRSAFYFGKNVRFNGGITAHDANDNAYFPRYYDFNDNNYYVDPAGDSQMNTIDIDDYIRHRGDTDNYFGFAAADTFRVFTGNAQRFNVDNNSADFTVNVYAPRYYDSNNISYYMDPASTSITNIMRANRYQIDGGSLFIDSANGDRGTIRVEGETGGYAGYAINNDWAFISDGATNMGIWNDTDNEWVMTASRNNAAVLYSNGIHQLSAQNGYGFAPTQMRSPIFYDSNNTAFFADMAGQTRLKSIKAGDSAINNNTTYPLEIKSAQQYLIGLQNTSADGNYPWITHNTRNSRSTLGIHFNGVGDRFWFEENGNFQAYGAGIFGSLALNGGNEDIGLLKTYGSGLADLKMFDASDYWDKRVIQAMQGSENPPTTNTNEYVKNGNGPFASSNALRSSAYRTFDSDYIPVEPGEDIYVEQAVRYISGTGGLFYLGVRRYDKNKNPIATNDGITYFGASAVNVTSTGWTQFKGTHTIPTSHTPFNGSDGEGVRYVRVISLMNYSAGGAVREFGPPILKRTNVQSDLVTPNLTVEEDLTVGGNATITGDLTVDDITADQISANRFVDRNKTSRYVEPAGPSSVEGAWNWNNGSITNLNLLTFNDPGPTEGIKWNGGNEWQIYESPNDLATNSAGNLQFTSGASNGTMRMRIETNGDVYAGRYSRAQRFYDTNNAAYYVDPASTSVMNQIYINEYIRHSGDTNTYVRMRADDMQLVAGGTQMLRMSEGTDPDRLRFVTDSNWTDGNGDWNMSRDITVGRIGTAVTSFNAPRFIDSDNTAYYGDFGGTSLMNVVRANQIQIDGATYIIDSPTGDYGTIKVDGAKGGWAGYVIRDDWAFMSSGAGSAGIYNDTNNEWAILAAQNSDVQIFFNGTWEERSRSGYMEARGSYRAPIFYDSNNTTYRINGNGTSRLLTLNVDNPIGGNINGYATTLLRKDNRVIEPNADPAGRLTFGFTSWNNNNTAPYADYLHMRSYTDSSGGSDNLLMFKKSGRGMRLWQQTWNSGTAYSAFSEFAVYNANPGAGNNLYASIYYDADDTAFRIDPTGRSQIKQLDVGSNVLSSTYTNAAIEVREYNYGGAQSDNYATAPRISFHWGGRVASQIAMASSGEIRIINNPGTGTENFRANNIRADGSIYGQRYYDSNSTGYYGDFASTSIMNVLDIRGEIYNDGWFRNDTSGRGLLSTPNSTYFYSSANNRWVARSDQTTARIDLHTSGNTRRGAFYANNSNEVGILSQDDGWALQTTNSKVDSHHNFYAPIMYDRSSTGYYVDPASTSVMNEIRVNAYIRHNGDTNTYIRFIGGDDMQLVAGGRQMLRMDEGTDPDRLRFVTDSNWTDANGDWAMSRDITVTRTGRANSDFRAPIFYDTNNTGRYVNPASTSQLGTVEWDQLNARDMGDFITFYGDNSQNHSISSRNASGSNADDLRINSYGSVFVNLDSNNNNTSAADFRIGRHGQATGTIANLDLFTVYGDANYAYSAFSFRAPIFYDSNNTGYYCDPSSASNFNTSVRANEVYARNWFRNDNATEGIYNTATGIHAYSYQPGYYAIAGNSNSSISLQLRSNYNSSIRMWLHGDTGSWCGYLNSGGQWQIRTRMSDGSSPNHWYYEDANTSWTGNPGNDKGKIEYHSDRFYIVAGGNSNRICQFRRDGSDKSYVDNNGVYVGTATSARWADLAERYSADAVYEPGTLLAVALDGDSEVTEYKSGMPLAGVVSTLPAYRMNDMGFEADDESIEAKMNPFIALKGRIPVLINGEAKKGQWIIADDNGKSKAVDYGTPGINSHEIIGIALSDSKNGEVEVKV